MGLASTEYVSVRSRRLERSDHKRSSTWMNLNGSMIADWLTKALLFRGSWKEKIIAIMVYLMAQPNPSFANPAVGI